MGTECFWLDVIVGTQVRREVVHLRYGLEYWQRWNNADTRL